VTSNSVLLPRELEKDPSVKCLHLLGGRANAAWSERLFAVLEENVVTLRKQSLVHLGFQF
jgi:hypothetical protein